MFDGVCLCVPSNPLVTVGQCLGSLAALTNPKLIPPHGGEWSVDALQESLCSAGVTESEFTTFVVVPVLARQV